MKYEYRVRLSAALAIMLVLAVGWFVLWGPGIAGLGLDGSTYGGDGSRAPRSADDSTPSLQGTGAGPGKGRPDDAPLDMDEVLRRILRELDAASASQDHVAIQDGIANLAEFLSANPRSVPEVIAAVKRWDREDSRRATLAGMLALGRCGRREALDALVGLHPNGLSESGVAVLPIALAQTRSPRPSPPMGKWIFSVLDGQVTEPIAESWLRSTLLEWYEASVEDADAMSPEWQRNILVVLGFSAVMDPQIFDVLRGHFSQTPGATWRPGSHHILAALGAAGDEDPRVVEFLWDLVMAAPTLEDISAAASAALGTRHPDVLRWAQQYIADSSRPIAFRLAVLAGVPGVGLDANQSILTEIAEGAVALLAAGEASEGGQSLTDLVPFFAYIQRVSSGDRRCAVAVGNFAAILLRHDGWQLEAAQRALRPFSSDEAIWLRTACERAVEEGLSAGAVLGLAGKVAGASIARQDQQYCMSVVVSAANKLPHESERSNTLRALRSIQDGMEWED